MRAFTVAMNARSKEEQKRTVTMNEAKESHFPMREKQVLSPV